MKIIKDETVLKQRSTQEQAKKVGHGKRKRNGKDPEVEEALNHWCSTVLAKGIRISGPVLKNKAEEFVQKLGRPELMTTDGWLSCWKARYQITFKRAHAEKGSADQHGWS